MRSAVRLNSPIRRQGFAFGPRRCSCSAPHSLICRQRGVPGPREGQPLISTRLSAPKGSHPDLRGAHRRPTTPQADRPPHPYSFSGYHLKSASLPAPRVGHSSRTAASQLGARNALHSQPLPLLAPVPFSAGVSFQDGRRYVLLSR